MRVLQEDRTRAASDVLKDIDETMRRHRRRLEAIALFSLLQDHPEYESVRVALRERLQRGYIRPIEDVHE